MKMIRNVTDQNISNIQNWSCLMEKVTTLNVSNKIHFSSKTIFSFSSETFLEFSTTFILITDTVLI